MPFKIVLVTPEDEDNEVLHEFDDDEKLVKEVSVGTSRGEATMIRISPEQVELYVAVQYGDENANFLGMEEQKTNEGPEFFTPEGIKEREEAQKASDEAAASPHEEEKPASEQKSSSSSKPALASSSSASKK